MKNMLKHLLVFLFVCPIYAQQPPCGLLEEITTSPVLVEGSIGSAFSPLIGNTSYLSVFGSTEPNGNLIQVYGLTLTDGILSLVQNLNLGNHPPAWIAYSPITNSGALFLAIGANTFIAPTLDIYTVNTGNGMLTLASSTTIPGIPFGIAYSPLLPNGSLYGVALLNTHPGVFQMFAYTVDTNTGQFNQIFSSSNLTQGANLQGRIAISQLIGNNLFIAFTTGGNEIFVYSLDTSTNNVSFVNSYTNTAHPKFLSFSPFISTTNSLFLAAPDFLNNIVDVYSVNLSSGALTFLRSTPSGGTEPMGVAYSSIIGSDTLYLAVANSNSISGNPGNYVIFNSDPSSGVLTQTDSTAVTIPGPIFVNFSPLFQSNIIYVAGTSNIGPGLNAQTHVYAFDVGPSAISNTLNSCAGQPFLLRLEALNNPLDENVLFTLTSPPSNGTFVINDPTTGFSTYTANPGFSGTDKIMFTATDQNGCTSAPGTITFIVSTQLPTANSASYTLCSNSSLSKVLTATPPSGSIIARYSIVTLPTKGTVVLTNEDLGNFTYTPFPNASGSDSFTFSATAFNGCTSLPATISLFVDNLGLSIVPSSLSVCVGGTIALTAQVPGGVPPLNFSWTGPNGFTATTQTITINNATVNNSGTYKVVVTDSNGCQGNMTASVTVNPNPTVTITPTSQTICAGNAITLTAEVTGGIGAEFIWTTPGRGTITTMSNVLTLTNSSLADSGNYTVVVIDTLGCTSVPSTPASVTVIKLLASIIPPSQFVIVGNPIILTAQVSGGIGVEFIWITPRGTIITSTNVLTLTDSTLFDTGNYGLIVIDQNGCRAQADPVTVTVIEPLMVTLITPCSTIRLCTPTTFIATATGGVPPYTFEWFDGVTETTATGIDTRIITINCNQTISVRVVDSIGNQATANARTALSQSISKKYCAQ